MQASSCWAGSLHYGKSLMQTPGTQLWPESPLSLAGPHSRPFLFKAQNLHHSPPLDIAPLLTASGSRYEEGAGTGRTLGQGALLAGFTWPALPGLHGVGLVLLFPNLSPWGRHNYVASLMPYPHLAHQGHHWLPLPRILETESLSACMGLLPKHLRSLVSRPGACRAGASQRTRSLMASSRAAQMYPVGRMPNFALFSKRLGLLLFDWHPNSGQTVLSLGGAHWEELHRLPSALPCGRWDLNVAARCLYSFFRPHPTQSFGPESKRTIYRAGKASFSLNSSAQRLDRSWRQPAGPEKHWQGSNVPDTCSSSLRCHSSLYVCICHM